MIDLISASQYLQQAWKNGLGFTEQIAVSPAGATLASGFRYRVSRAQVNAGGPFSAFPGCDRILTVIEGDGLSLVRGGSTETLAPLEPFRFSGDEQVSAVLARGAIVDFNLIFDRARIDAACERLDLDGRPRALHAGHARGEHLLYCVSGSLVCEGVVLSASDSARVGFENPSVPPVIRAQGAAALALHATLWPR